MCDVFCPAGSFVRSQCSLPSVSDLYTPRQYWLGKCVCYECVSGTVFVGQSVQCASSVCCVWQCVFVAGCRSACTFGDVCECVFSWQWCAVFVKNTLYYYVCVCVLHVAVGEPSLGRSVSLLLGGRRAVLRPVFALAERMPRDCS